MKTNQCNRLLTNQILKFMRLGFWYGEKGQTHPYNWEKKEFQPKLVSSKKRKFLYSASIAGSVCYITFLMIRLVQVCFVWNGTTHDIKVYMGFKFSMYSFILVSYLNVSCKQEQLLAFVNGTMIFLSNYEGCRYALTDTSERKSKNRSPDSIVACEKFMKAIFICLNIHAFILAIHPIIRPTSPEFVSSILLPLIEKPVAGNTTPYYLLRVAIIAVSSIFQAWMIYIQYSLLFLHLFILLAAVVPTLVAADELRISPRSQRDSLGPDFNSTFICNLSFNQYKDCPSWCEVMTWKSIQLIVHELNQVFSVFIAGLKVNGIVAAVLCMCGAIKLSGLLGAFLGFLGTTLAGILVGTFILLFGFNEKSKLALDNWKHPIPTPMPKIKIRPHRRQHRGNKFKAALPIYATLHPVLRRKYVQSLNIFFLTISGVYRIDKVMVITMVRFILESTVNLILITR